MKDYMLPTNIKQIGSIGDGIRIYMEDYVCTYLNQYAQAGGYDERLALLVGKYLLIDGYPILFVNGAIQGKYTAERDGLLYFTDQTVAYAEAMIAEFFEGMEVVGWMQTQPGYGIFLNQQYAAYHFREFPKVNQVMFVVDPLENVNAFYTYNDDRTALTEVRGYFIYYEKNTNMHEYMLSNKAAEAEFTAKQASYTEPGQAQWIGSSPFGEGPAPEEVIRRRQKERTVKKSAKEQRKTLNLLVSMSAVLFMVSFVLGAGLVQSQNRLESMETQILQLNAAYRNLYTQIANPVFAPAESDALEAAPEARLEATAGYQQEIFIVDDSIPSSATEPAENREIDGIPVHPPVNVPVPPAAPAPAPTEVRIVPETYTIQPGDSLSQISLYFYGVDRVAEILALNGMTDPNMIIAGSTILLP